MQYNDCKSNKEVKMMLYEFDDYKWRCINLMITYKLKSPDAEQKVN